MRIVVRILFIIAIVLGASSEELRPADRVTAAPEPQTYIPPVITVWYGDEQYFTNGTPQNFINIVGNVNGGDPDHKWLGIYTLTYSLNGSEPRSLSIGEDNNVRRRLAKRGDFNIDISVDDPKLFNGRNEVVITAVNRATPPQTTQRKVYFTYDKNKTWELPYSVDWKTVTNLQDAVQVVDGYWRIEGDGIRIVEWGYDRVLAIGERTWTNYEILVSFTLNAIDETKYDSSISLNPGLGIYLRWLGHTDTPVSCSQPECGWEPFGGEFWYEFFKDKSKNGFYIIAEPPDSSRPGISMDLEVGSKYWLRAYAESNTSGTLYQSKIWKDGTSEPNNWMLEKQTDPTNLTHGSFLLVAHHTDVTFHHITAVPLTGRQTNQTIQITRHAPSSMMIGGKFTVSATASSGLPVTITSGSPDVCTYQNGIFTVIRSGSSCIVQYSQSGNASYYPAPVVQEITRTGYVHYIPSIRR